MPMQIQDHAIDPLWILLKSLSLAWALVSDPFEPPAHALDNYEPANPALAANGEAQVAIGRAFIAGAHALATHLDHEPSKGVLSHTLMMFGGMDPIDDDDDDNWLQDEEIMFPLLMGSLTNTVMDPIERALGDEGPEGPQAYWDGLTDQQKASQFDARTLFGWWLNFFATKEEQAAMLQSFDPSTSPKN